MLVRPPLSLLVALAALPVYSVPISCGPNVVSVSSLNAPLGLAEACGWADGAAHQLSSSVRGSTSTTGQLLARQWGLEKVPDNCKAVILFDGVCNFCNAWVNIVVDNDPEGS
eukprot:jgi/Bigna1/81840/fgenesh1_pg.85_\